MITTSPITLHDLENLAGLREELRLQSHLFKADLKDRWHEAEQRWHEVQSEAQAIRAAVGHSRAELGAAASLTASALRESYTELRRALRPH
jgi:hypothetical protein